MAKRWARSRAEANQMFLVKGTGTCQGCGVEFHRLSRSGMIPPHQPGSLTITWLERRWPNGSVTYQSPGTGACSGSKRRSVEDAPPPLPPRPPVDPATVLVKSRLTPSTRDGRPRDSQKGKVYGAENSAAWTSKARANLTQDEAQALADRMHDWLIDQGHYLRPPKITVRRGEGATASPWNGAIHLGNQRPVAWILAHEMAHLVRLTPTAFPGREWDRDGRWHGWEFCSVYLALVRRFFGVKDHDALRDAFKAKRVKFRPKRRMTEAQRAASAARLAEYRVKA